MKHKIFIVFAFFALLLVNSQLSRATVLEGIVLSEKGVLENAVVHAYPDYKSLAARHNSIMSTPGEKEGQFKLELPPGKYYLTAEGSLDKQDFYSYHGLNPITISAESHNWVPFFALPKKAAKCDDGFQGIGGHVYYQGKPVSDGGISVYSIEDEPYRGMGLLTNTINAEGEYWFDLEPGKYVLVARKRASSTGIGPIQQGDLFCYSSANPVEVKSASSCDVDLLCYPRNDLDNFLDAQAADPRGRRQEKRSAMSLKDVPAQESTTIPKNIPKQPAIISGKVLDTTGAPREGLFVSAYPAEDLDLFQMYIVRFKTKYMARTDSQGRYKLDIENGSYYLVARELVAEAPIPLEYYGIYEGSPNHNIVVRPGEERSDANITVGKIMP